MWSFCHTHSCISDTEKGVASVDSDKWNASSSAGVLCQDQHTETHTPTRIDSYAQTQAGAPDMSTPDKMRTPPSEEGRAGIRLIGRTFKRKSRVIQFVERCRGSVTEAHKSRFEKHTHGIPSPRRLRHLTLKTQVSFCAQRATCLVPPEVEV